MSVNNYRKCAKCGKTRVVDMSVSYHRFPYPGPTNIVKARAWATYCWPDQDWSTVESLNLLYRKSKVLCGRHFSWSQFYDSHRQKLSKFAVPESNSVQEILNQRDNVFVQDVNSPCDAGKSIPRPILSQIENLQTSYMLEASTSLESSSVEEIRNQSEKNVFVQDVNSPCDAGKSIPRPILSQIENLQTSYMLEASTSLESSSVEEIRNQSEKNVFIQDVSSPFDAGKSIPKPTLSQKENIQAAYLFEASTSSESTSVEEILNQRENMFVQDVNSSCDIRKSIPTPILSQIEKNQAPYMLEASTSSELPIKKQSSNLPSKSGSSKSSKKKGGILSAINVSKTSEMTSREMKLYAICRRKMKEITRLRKKLKNKKNNKIRLISDDENIQQLFNLNMSNSFVVLLQSQLKNCPKKPKGRRYSLAQKIMALVLYKKSPACYRLLRRMFTLPCQSSLNKLLNRVPLRPGINTHVFTSLKKMSSTQSEEENICVLSFDEMAIRKHFNYDQKLDEIQGFQDHANHGRSNQVATKALVFMLAGLRKKWKQPVAFYFSHTLTADRMTVIVKQILTECINADMNVVATVCDLSTVNIKVLKTLGATTRQPYFSHSGREIVTVLDSPHLLKCTRNLFMKHNIQYTSDVQCNGQNVKGTAKWSHIEDFHKLDKNNPNFVYAPALTDNHIKPNTKQQMRVKLAAQVFSHSVTAGILAKVASNELPNEAIATATLLQKFDQLFDAVNADSPDLRRGKKYSTNMTMRSPHAVLFGEMRKFISTMTYIGSRLNPPSQEGWIQTMNAIERLWKNLQSRQIKSLSTRRLNQDPLENCFGCIRYNSGSNNNPTTQQFISGIKTAIISNLRHSGQKRNCEADTATLANNFSSFLMSDSAIALNFESVEFDYNQMEILLADAVEAVELTTPESQACGYVCGFIFKKLRHSECPECKNAFLSETLEAHHIFSSYKEYDVSHSSLNYVNKDMILCVESMANIINSYLSVNAWKNNIKKTLMTALDCVDTSFLNKCVNHVELNNRHIKNCTFYICLNKYIISKNREMEEEEKKKALERKYRILRNN